MTPDLAVNVVDLAVGKHYFLNCYADVFLLEDFDSGAMLDLVSELTSLRIFFKEVNHVSLRYDIKQISTNQSLILAHHCVKPELFLVFLDISICIISNLFRKFSHLFNLINFSFFK